MPTTSEHQPLGLDPRTAEAMVYVPFLGFLAAIVFLVTEKGTNLRWHAAQSLMTYLVFIGLYWVVLPLMRVTVVLVPLAVLLGGLAGVGFLVVWLILAVKTHQGETVRLPVVAQLADRLVKKA